MRAFSIVNFFANIVDDSSVTNTACSYQQLVDKPTEKVGGLSAPLGGASDSAGVLTDQFEKIDNRQNVQHEN